MVGQNLGNAGGMSNAYVQGQGGSSGGFNPYGLGQIGHGRGFQENYSSKYSAGRPPGADGLYRPEQQPNINGQHECSVQERQ